MTSNALRLFLQQNGTFQQNHEMINVTIYDGKSDTPGVVMCINI